jgi:lipopolysaccharide/colanic/teichoic acid biosynthesis glycosyltransferase
MFPGMTESRPAGQRALHLGTAGISSSRHLSQRRALIASLILCDAAMIALALYLAWFIRIGSGWLDYRAPAHFQFYAQITLLSILIMLPIFAFNRLYDYPHLLSGMQEYSGVLRACSYGMIVLVVMSYLERSQPLSRGWLLASWGLTILLVGSSRFVVRRVFQWLRKHHGWLIVRAIIVGANDHAEAIARQLTTQNAGIQIIGFLDDYLPAGTALLGGYRVLGTPSQLHELTVSHDVKQVIVVSNAVAWETFHEIMQEAGFSNGFDIQLSPGFYEILTSRVEVTHSAFVPLLRIQQPRITGLDLMLKVMLDFGLGSLLVLLTLPLMILIGLAIWRAGGGPVIERTPGMGLRGKIFQTRRFRTGLQGTAYRRFGAPMPGENPENVAFSSKLGSFLYRTGLDKLPQLFDVLLGHMSLVGPRLISPDQESAIRPWLANLLSVKPGWIGPWAVSGINTPHEKVLFDLYYVRNWTIWLDLQVIFQASQRVLFARSRRVK